MNTDYLVIYSSELGYTFSNAIKCQKASYNFNTATIDTFKKIIIKAVNINRGRLKRVAIANHSSKSNNKWEISQHIKFEGNNINLLNWANVSFKEMSIPTKFIYLFYKYAFLENKDKDNVNHLDLLGCGLAGENPHLSNSSKWQNQLILMSDLEKSENSWTNTIYGLSTNKTGNAPNGDWIMEYPNGLNIKDFYFSDEIVKWKGTLNSGDISDQNLFYGTDGSQTIRLNFGSYSFISFNVVDDTKKTIANLFTPLATNNSHIIEIIIWDETWTKYVYNRTSWSGGPSSTAVRFDKGYYVKLEENTSTGYIDWTINGTDIWKTNIKLTKGWNFTGWPNDEDGIDLANSSKGLFYFPEVGSSNSSNLWDNLIKIFNAGGASYANGGGNPLTGMLTNNSGKAFLIEMNDNANSYTYSYQNDDVQPTVVPEITNIELINFNTTWGAGNRVYMQPSKPTFRIKCNMTGTISIDSPYSQGEVTLESTNYHMFSSGVSDWQTFTINIVASNDPPVKIYSNIKINLRTGTLGTPSYGLSSWAYLASFIVKYPITITNEGWVPSSGSADAVWKYRVNIKYLDPSSPFSELIVNGLRWIQTTIITKESNTDADFLPSSGAGRPTGGGSLEELVYTDIPEGATLSGSYMLHSYWYGYTSDWIETDITGRKVSTSEQNYIAQADTVTLTMPNYTGPLVPPPPTEGGDGTGPNDAILLPKYQLPNGVTSVSVVVDTVGSSIGDTMLGLWEGDGTYITYDDDGGGSLMSRISRTLSKGIYIYAIGSYRTTFGASFYTSGPSSKTGNAKLNVTIGGSALEGWDGFNKPYPKSSPSQAWFKLEITDVPPVVTQSRQVLFDRAIALAKYFVYEADDVINLPGTNSKVVVTIWNTYILGEATTHHTTLPRGLYIKADPFSGNWNFCWNADSGENALITPHLELQNSSLNLGNPAFAGANTSYRYRVPISISPTLLYRTDVDYVHEMIYVNAYWDGDSDTSTTLKSALKVPYTPPPSSKINVIQSQNAGEVVPWVRYKTLATSSYMNIVDESSSGYWDWNDKSWGTAKTLSDNEYLVGITYRGSTYTGGVQMITLIIKNQSTGVEDPYTLVSSSYSGVAPITIRATSGYHITEFRGRSNVTGSGWSDSVPRELYIHTELPL